MLIIYLSEASKTKNLCCSLSHEFRFTSELRGSIKIPGVLLQSVEVEQKQSIITCITPACRDPALKQSPVVLGSSYLCMHSLSPALQSHFWRNLPAVPEGFWSPGRSSALNSTFLWKPLSTECQKSVRKQHLFPAVLTCRTVGVKSKSLPSSRECLSPPPHRVGDNSSCSTSAE